MKGLFVSITLAAIVAATFGLAPASFADTCNQNLTLTRPIPLGVSGGNINDSSWPYCWGATLGAMVKDSAGTDYILSNSHVFGRCNTASSGEAIVQPSLVNTNCQRIANDTVAKVSRYTHLLYGGAVNYDDAAIAQVVPGDVSSSIENIGNISVVTLNAFSGLHVEKMGAYSCLTAGQVLGTGVYAWSSVADCGGAEVYYGKLIEVLIQGGGDDSGSLIVSQPPCPEAVGLMIAAAPGTNYVYAIPINTVLSDLGVSMVGGTCTTAPTTSAEQAQTGPLPDELAAQKVVSDNAASLLSIPGVVLVGVTRNGNGKIVIFVGVEEITPEIQSEVPSTLGGFPVRLEKRKPLVSGMTRGRSR